LGKTIFLIDGLSFSTAAEFCAIAKSNKRGLFVGEETGGGYYGNNSGSFVEVVLPNTKLIVSIPTIKYTMDVSASTAKARGIRPDIQIIPTIAEVLREEDAPLNFAISLAGKK
jgi:C-terminal processing protease CtpA/Prc